VCQFLGHPVYCRILHIQSPQPEGGPLPSQLKAAHRSASAPWCLDPDTNFRLARQRSRCFQGRRKEVESGGDTLAPSAGKKFCRARPLFWLYVYNWSFWRVLSWWLIWSVSCFCFSNHGAPRAQPFVKMRGRCPRALFIRCRWLFLFVRNVHCKLTLFNIHLCVEMCILRKQWRF